MLANLRCVDFRTDLQPLKQKLAELSDVLPSEEPLTMREAAKCRLVFTEYMNSGGTSEIAQRIPGHNESVERRMYDRSGDQLTLKEIESAAMLLHQLLLCCDLNQSQRWL
jgi:hypothetical protein